MGGFINILDLDVGYKSKAVAENLNFQLEKGDLCAIVGVNGIGKSTLIRSISNLQPKLSGTIQIDGIDVDGITPASFAKMVSVVLTEPIASKNLTVYELIALGRQPHTNWLGQFQEKDRDTVRTSIELFELHELAHRKCHELSDGQMQRVLIARAMAQDTYAVVLDEPTTHLDLFHKVQILKLLQQMAHTHKKAILFSTHEIDLAIQLCDKILILNADTNPFGTPSDLIKQGHFEQLFPPEMVQFDIKTSSFKVKK